MNEKENATSIYSAISKSGELLNIKEKDGEKKNK